MKRILILGCPGSGKSTFAQALQSCTGLPLIHLDNLWWNPDRSHVTRDAFDEKLAFVMRATDAWILDGDYSRTYEVRMKACDTVFFLDYGEAECMAGIRARVGKTRPDMPWTEDVLDPELVEEVQTYRQVQRPAVMELLRQYPEKERFIFHTRPEAEQWLAAYRLRRGDPLSPSLPAAQMDSD